MGDSLPAWLFRTREGGVGVLHIAVNSFPNVAARYKLVRGTSQPLASKRFSEISSGRRHPTQFERLHIPRILPGSQCSDSSVATR